MRLTLTQHTFIWIERDYFCLRILGVDFWWATYRKTRESFSERNKLHSVFKFGNGRFKFLKK